MAAAELGRTTHFAAQIVLTNPALPTDEGELPPGAISLTVSRMLDRGGLRETLALRNHAATSARLSLAVRIGCDFADIFDVKSNRLVPRGDTVTRWWPEEGRMETVHANQGFRRGISVRPADGFPKPEMRDGAICFVAELASQAIWQADLLYQVVDGDDRPEASQAAYAERWSSAQVAALKRWRSQAMRLRTPYIPLQLLCDQSMDDLAALRLPIDGTDATCFVPAAGILWFVALFGRRRQSRRRKSLLARW